LTGHICQPIICALGISSLSKDCDLTSRKTSAGSGAARGSGDDFGDRLEREMHEFVRWFNNDVVPKVRTGSGKGLRVASKKLAEFADYLDKHKK
jgi:hypothetical protein